MTTLETPFDLRWTEAEPGLFHASGRMDTQAAEALRAALLDLPSHSVVVDLSGIEFCGTACTQLLLAARDHARKTGIEFQMRNVAEPVRAAWKTLGLSEGWETAP